MEIEYLGHSGFLIEGRKGSILTDPFFGVGYEMRRVSADIVLVSHAHKDHNYIDGVKPPFEAITEIGKKFGGVRLYHDREQGKKRGSVNCYYFEVDGFKLLHLGDVGEPPTDEVIKKLKALGEIDVLFVPVGGYYTIDANEAKEYVERLKPKIAIPMHYKTKKCSFDVITSKDKFLTLFDNFENINGSLNLTEIKRTQTAKTRIITFDNFD